MGQGSKNCKQPSHQRLKDKAKNRVEDLQSMLNELQVARKESRAGDVATLEEQVNQILREWKIELDEPTPTSSSLEGSLGSFSAGLCHLLRQYEEKDDAISPLSEPPAGRVENVSHGFPVLESAENKEVGCVNYIPHQNEFPGFGNHISHQHVAQGFDHFDNTGPSLQGTVISDYEAASLYNMVADNLEMTSLLDCLNFDGHQNFENEIFIGPAGAHIEQWGVDDVSDCSSLLPNVNPPPSAFLGPKCALWDCARPVQISEGFGNYCSNFHAELAVKECPPGTRPILRPGGIDLKDGPLLSALRAKIEGKDVGIPECPGAATTKSPWKAPELFDVSILEGEKIREWLFFDKPRRAFETGNRKQRSLPDHKGRGWHESRKLIMKELGGHRRSYFADPQPLENLEWHLFEYEIDDYDSFALYRLELKVADEKKKSPKTKGTNDPLVDLQKKMDRLTAESSAENKSSGKEKGKGKEKSDLKASVDNGGAKLFTDDGKDC